MLDPKEIAKTALMYIARRTLMERRSSEPAADALNVLAMI
jgi:hypothetical protein